MLRDSKLQKSPEHLTAVAEARANNVFGGGVAVFAADDVLKVPVDDRKADVSGPYHPPFPAVMTRRVQAVRLEVWESRKIGRDRLLGHIGRRGGPRRGLADAGR